MDLDFIIKKNLKQFYSVYEIKLPDVLIPYIEKIVKESIELEKIKKK